MKCDLCLVLLEYFLRVIHSPFISPTRANLSSSTVLFGNYILYSQTNTVVVARPTAHRKIQGTLAKGIGFIVFYSAYASVGAYATAAATHPKKKTLIKYDFIIVLLLLR